MTATKPRYQAEQLELPLQVTASPAWTVRRVENHIVLTPKPVEMWGSTMDAAAMIRRSDRFVRMLCAAGIIPCRRLPGARRWDVNLIGLQEWAEGGSFLAE